MLLMVLWLWLWLWLWSWLLWLFGTLLDACVCAHHTACNQAELIQNACREPGGTILSYLEMSSEVMTLWKSCIDLNKSSFGPVPSLEMEGDEPTPTPRDSRDSRESHHLSHRKIASPRLLFCFSHYCSFPRSWSRGRRAPHPSTTVSQTNNHVAERTLHCHKPSISTLSDPPRSL